MLSILDTSVLIAVHAAPVEGDIAISVVSIAELQFGVLAAGDDESRAHGARLVTANVGDVSHLGSRVEIVPA